MRIKYIATAKMCLAIMRTNFSFPDCGLILHYKNSLQLAYSVTNLNQKNRLIIHILIAKD